VFEGAQLRVDFQSDATSYYILYRGIQVDYINQAVGMALGVGPSDSIVAPAGSDPSGFFRLRRVAIGNPADTDGDGIDDVSELSCVLLDPLNTLDAFLDSDQDGKSNLDEALSGSDPCLPDVFGNLAP